MTTQMHLPRVRQLAAALSAVFGLASAAHATTFVTSCLDDGSPGTLRVILAAAANNDVIDVSSQSMCSNITLTQGELPVSVSVLLTGPGSGTFTIDGAHRGRVLHSMFNSPGYDNLHLSNLTISGGRVYTAGSDATGGCILSGNVYLQDVVVSDCIAGAAGGNVSGGAVRADKIYLTGSRIENSAAYGAGDGVFAVGGGAGADTLFHCVNSTITGNRALSSRAGEGGGIEVNWICRVARWTTMSPSTRGAYCSLPVPAAR